MTKKQPNSDKLLKALNDDVVCQYLQQQPQFFIRQAAQLQDLAIPHPIRGAISLPEWLMARQRKQISQYQQQLTQLMQQAAENQYLFEQLIQLQKRLLVATDMQHLLQILKQWAKELGLLGAYLYLFTDKWQIDPPSQHVSLAMQSRQFEFIRLRHLQYQFHYLGRLNPTEVAFLCPDQPHVGSVAMSMLGDFGDLGVLLFASRYANHYQAGQGTLLLEKLSQLLPLIIMRWIMRRK